ncbi:MAG: lamin tail domain-containing protein [Fibrobacterota bacterium]|nr:lamin tail domain-containing protein [Fibrobacterota bacterium]QQS07160.1 MAG: lamin tail domain-containing protein [Fibrobacterota bacterium]
MSMFPLPAILALSAAVRLSEIQASPPAGLPEFIELSGSPAVRLSGWSLDDGSVRRPLPEGATLPASGVLVVSPDCRAIREAWAGVDIPCAQSASWGRLSMESDIVVLRDSLGNVADSVQWSARTWGEWPRGKSRVRVSNGLPGSDPASWRTSRASQGASPGWLEAPEESVAEPFVFESVRKAVRPGDRNLLRLRAVGSVRVEVFDLARRRLGIVFEGEAPATGTVEWDGRVGGRNLTPGVYLILAACGSDSRRIWIAVGKP